MKKSIIVLGLALTASPRVLAADQVMDTQKTDKAAMEQMQSESKPAPPSKSMKMHNKKPAKKTEMKTEKYRCPMDTDVVSDKPGKCPKCGMALEKVTTEQPKAM